MVRVPRPQSTLLPGLGVAVAVLAAVILAFASTGAIVAVDLSSGDPRPRSAQPIVVAGPPPPVPATTPLGPTTPSAVETALAQRAQPPAAAPPVAPPVQDAALAAQVIALEPAALPAPPAVPALPAAPPPPPPVQGVPAPAPRGGPLAPVGDAVQDTTTGLANTLRGVTTELGDTISPVSPQLGGVVDSAGALLGDTLGATGALLAGLLGRRAPG